MEFKREADRKMKMRFFNAAKRIWIDVLVLLLMFGLSFLLPDTPDEASKAGSQLNLMALFITKTNSILWPWLIVDIVRKWKWPYLDLQCLINGRDREGNEIKHATWGIAFLMVIYYVVIYAFAVGG
jgi:hypothetical protein